MWLAAWQSGNVGQAGPAYGVAGRHGAMNNDWSGAGRDQFYRAKEASVRQGPQMEGWL